MRSATALAIFSMITFLLSSSQAFAASGLESAEWLDSPVEWKGSQHAAYPEMVVVDDNIYVGWSSSGLMFSRSTDGGNTFSEPIKLAENPKNIVAQVMFKIAANGDNVYMVYSNEKDVFLVRSTDKGTSFSESVNISRMNIEPDSVAMVTFPVISVAGDRVYVAWVTSSPGWSEIFFAQSSDGGTSFGEHQNVSNNPVLSSDPKIAAYDKYVYLAWTDTPEPYSQVSFAVSKDGGHSFESRQNASFDETKIAAANIQVAADEKYGYITWDEGYRDEDTEQNTQSAIFARIAHLQNEPDFIKQIAIGGITNLAVTNGNVYATTTPPEQGIGNVAFIRSLDGGETFSDQKIISNQTWSLHPRDSGPSTVMAANGANVFVAWRYTESSDLTSTHVTYLAASYDRGETFTSPINASKSWGDTDRDSRIMVAAGTNDRLFLLWQTITESGPELWLVKGQIPDEYAAPYREVSFMTPVEPYDAGRQFFIIIGAGAAIAGAVAFLTLRKRKQLG